MILPDEPKAQDVPKIIQPRNHKAKVSVWADLTVDDLDRINESLNADHIKMVLADIFHLDDHKTSLKTGIVMDLYYYTLQFARENKFTKEQTSAFFSIVKKTHEICIETPFGNLDETFSFFKEMVLCHAVN
ncbi:cilia- and flagella-associated protein 119-like, partial [Ruditapes philippinarum]|uniref:cilia- and flagella-associated protein 119-like n=1 Tax=Ruditapes philippinarum TaxID=129788 RepID=UPI00295AFC8F